MKLAKHIQNSCCIYISIHNQEAQKNKDIIPKLPPLEIVDKIKKGEYTSMQVLRAFQAKVSLPYILSNRKLTRCNYCLMILCNTILVMSCNATVLPVILLYVSQTLECHEKTNCVCYFFEEAEVSSYDGNITDSCLEASLITQNFY